MYVALQPGAHDYWLLFEGEEQGGYVIILKEKTKILDIIRYENETDFKKNLGYDSKGVIDFKQFKKATEFEKLNNLSEWADLVYLIRELEVTRGGELIEFLFLLISQQTDRLANNLLKYEFFYKEDITISTMLKELVEFFKVVPVDYKDPSVLREKVLERTGFHVSRLNTLSRRFTKLETMGF